MPDRTPGSTDTPPMSQGVGGAVTATPGGTAVTRTRHDADQQQILEQVRAMAAPPQREAVVDFARMALRRLPAEDLRLADPERTARRLLDAFAFADQNREGMSAIRVFVPDEPLIDTAEPTTLVEIHTEDRPFLLATVQAELDAVGLGARFR